MASRWNSRVSIIFFLSSSSSRCEEDTHYVSFQWEFCPSDFTPYGRYTHTKDEEFNATFLCDDCIKKTAKRAKYIEKMPELPNFESDCQIAIIILDEASALNGSKQPLGFDGITDVKVERRLKVQGDLQNGVANVVPVSSDEVGKQEVIAALVANVEGMIKFDRKITSLKQLQGHIWRTGFEKNELKGVVFMMFLALFKNGILLEQEGNKKLCRNFRITWIS
ncbi:hypothetical protein L2E82_30724 [Cichorium intybus]|uniref:Uncharacterized protein n=1 Tax=Cichorium intybus TaxID=13427 RepID=A0ACB9D1A9_CICIN|nr:hypothetical protein L2E82_30724 [Cichorium intybus]